MKLACVACLLLPVLLGCSAESPPPAAADRADAVVSPRDQPPAAGAVVVAADTSDAVEEATVVPVRTPEQAARFIREPDVIFVPTPQPVVDAMLRMADVRPGDVLYDLGSGDGRIPITAARKYGVRSTGIDINPVRIEEANANAAAAGVTALVTFRQQDLFEADFSDATVVTLYLLDSLNEKLRPKLLRELKPGTRIVSHAFRMGDWPPQRTAQVDGSTIYLWTVPERAGKAATRS